MAKSYKVHDLKLHISSDSAYPNDLGSRSYVSGRVNSIKFKVRLHGILVWLYDGDARELYRLMTTNVTIVRADSSRRSLSSDQEWAIKKALWPVAEQVAQDYLEQEG